jgi:ribA/ribD-fused uncharacterized protein
VSIFPEEDTNSLYLSRIEQDEILGTYSDHGFQLEDKHWPSVEHYFQAAKFNHDEAYSERIRQAATPAKARKLGRTRWRSKLRKDWKQVREVIMTRGIYTKCRTHADVSEKLLGTEDQKLVENSQYDYFWGCGRDRRGENAFGKVLMNVRKKLRQEVTNP